MFIVTPIFILDIIMETYTIEQIVIDSLKEYFNIAIEMHKELIGD